MKKMRLEALALNEIDELRPELERTKSVLGFVPNSLLIMARRPDLVRGFGHLAAEVFKCKELQPALKELIAHIASTAAGCLYCQAHTANKASKYDQTQEKLDNVWEFEQSDLFDDAEKAALRVARDAAFVPNAVTDEHFEDLRKYYSEAQIVDIVGIVSLFGFLNRWNDTFATPLEDEPKVFAEKTIASRGWRAGKHGTGTTE